MAQDSIEKQLEDAEKRTGLPAGVLGSVLRQETGGKQAYLDDPAKYHYEANAEGKRIAGHTGKVSTAFGPFGILESTGAKPGYGVEPLKDKTLGEQIRFASDYLSARIKSAGSVAAGLAGYGEGPKYAAQVLKRAGQDVPAVAPYQPLPDAPPRDAGWPVLPTARSTPQTAPATADLSVINTGNAQMQALANPADSHAQTAQAVAGAVDLQAQKDAVGFGSVFDTARHDPRIQPMFTALDYVNRDKEEVPEGWTYAGVRDEVEAGHSDEEREYLRENATGPQALAQAQAQIAMRRDMDKQYGLAGGFTAFAGQMAGGMMDPVGFALGLGAGKALQSVGIGSAALANAGRTGAAATSFLAENALANISVEAMQDAMGEVKTSADYAMAGASGVALAAPFLRGATRGNAAAHVQQLTDDLKTNAMHEQMGKVSDELATGVDAPTAVRNVQERELADIMATVQESRGPQRRDQVVPSALAEEQRRMFDGTAEMPTMDHPRNPPTLTDVVNEPPTLTDVVPERDINLMNWFGDSKVVTPEGTPQVVYHGTSSDISSFETSALGSNTGAVSARKGFFFTSSPVVADGYAQSAGSRNKALFKILKQSAEKEADGPGVQKMLDDYFENRKTDTEGSGANVMPVYLAVKNPLEVDMKGANAAGGGFPQRIAEAQAAGHDGVIFRNVNDSVRRPGVEHLSEVSDVFVVFDSKNIKSATGNSGEFNPKTGDIMNAGPESPHAVPFNPDDWDIPQRVEQASKGTVTTVLPTEGGPVKLDFFWLPQGRPAPGPNVFTVKDMMQAAFEKRPGSVSTTARYFLSRLSDDVLSMPVKLMNAKPVGRFKPSSASIEVSTKTAGEGRLSPKEHLADMSPYEQYVLIHEVGHAATHTKIEAYLQAPESLAPDLRAAMDQLADLHTRYKAEVKRLYPSKDTTGYTQAAYGTQNLHEFAAQMWSDPVQRNVLRGMEGKTVAGKFSSAWKDFINVISKILGLEGKDGLTEGTQILDHILSADGSNISYANDAPALSAGPQPPPVQAAAFARKFAAGMHQHARDYMQKNPIDTKRLKVLTAKIGGLSDGLVLAASQNPIMQMVASLVTETTTGAAGRKPTAAIRYSTLDTVFMGNSMPEYNGAFEVWAGAKGKTLSDKYIRGDAQREFGKEVYTETLNRRDQNYTANADPNVVRAADALEKTFDRARVAQVEAGTLGSNHLAASSRGYMPQALDGNKLQTLTTAELHGVHTLMSEQFQSRLGWDAAFADMFAPYYTDRVRKRAQGSNGIDAMGAGGDSGQIVRDTLEEMSLDPNSRDRDAARQAAAGLGQTKRRLDLDLRAEFAPGRSLMDVYVTDPLTLTRMYSRRTAGTVALTESGIHGVQGMRQLRDAAGEPVDGSGLPSAAEFDAFDRVMTEILGTPVAGKVVSAGATNLTLAVSLQRMGGLVFTQAVETFQLIHATGLRSVMSGVPSIGRFLGEVGRLKKGEASGNNILTSMEVQGGEWGMSGYKMVAPLDPPDAMVGQYMEQSGLAGRLLRAGGHLQSKISGFRGLMAVQHRMAAEEVTKKALRYIREGKDDIALNDMGFTKEVRDSMRGDLNKVATFDANGNLTGFDFSQVSDPRTAEAFLQSVHRGVNQIIQGTFVGERNKWFHNDYLRAMLQLRTFGLTAVEKQWGRQVQNHGGGAKGYTYAAGMLIAQMALALPVHAARVQLASTGREDREKFIKDNMNPAALIRATMNYASMSGLTGDMLDIVTAVGGGWGDEETKEIVGARQQAMGVGRIIPAAGSIDQAFKVASGQADLHTALKQLPFSNLWYMLPAINLTKGD